MTTPQARYERRRRAGITRAWVSVGIVAGLALFLGLAVLLGGVRDLHGHRSGWLGAGAVVLVAAVGLVGIAWRPWEKRP